MEETMMLTMKLKLLTLDDQEKNLNKTMIIYTEACNYVSDYIYVTHNLKQRRLHDELYYEIRDKFGLKSQMASSVIRTVIAKYKTILKKEEKWIKAEFKKIQYDLVWNRDYSFTTGMISINTVEGRIKLFFEKKGMEQYFNSKIYQFGTAHLINKKGIYYIYIPVKFKVTSIEISKIKNVVGIDQGINFIITTYDSNHKTNFISGRQIKQKRLHYQKIRGELQKKHTSSARRRLKKIGRRENRWINDVNHKITKALVDEYSANTIFAVEDLKGIQKKVKNIKSKQQKHVHTSWAYSDFIKKLEYKARKRNSQVIKMDPRYTSQTCPRCGHIEKENRNKKIHLFKCKTCGYQSNDDRVAAINLYYMGVQYIKSEQIEKAVVAE